MNIDESLSKTFDIQPAKQSEIIPANTATDVVVVNDKIEDDYEITRNNLRLILQQGQSALMKALDVAHQSEHPRAFEVVGNLMKQLADVNQQLLDLHQQKQKLDTPKQGSKKEVTNNNVIFTGSTADLNKLIQNMSKGD